MVKYTVYKHYNDDEVNEQKISEAINAILTMKHLWSINNEDVIKFFKSDYDEDYINFVLNNETYNNKFIECEKINKMINII